MRDTTLGEFCISELLKSLTKLFPFILQAWKIFQIFTVFTSNSPVSEGINYYLFKSLMLYST